MPAKASFMENVKKNHFWILTGAIALLSLVFWYLGVSASLADIKKSNDTAAAKRKEAESKASIRFHANDKFKEEMNGLIGKRKKIILAAWQSKFKEQWGIILRWPQELPQNFRDFVESKTLNAIEEITAESEAPGKEHWMRGELSRVYRDHVEKELPKLAQRVKAEWNPIAATSSSSGGSTPDRQPMAGEKKPLVIWDPKNEGEIRQRIMSRLDKPDNAPPTTREVLYSQEDLWVLDALMTIIADTNGNATEHEKAPIREIRFIKLGGDAMQATSTVIRSKNAAAATGEGAPSTAAPPPSTHAGSGNLAEGGAQGSAPDPADGRYVDKDLQIVSGQQLREAISTNDPAKAYLAVAKRMPVRMRLIINQQRLPELLVNCGNSSLMVEVQQVRIGNFESDKSSGSGSGTARPTVGGEGSQAGIDPQQQAYPYVEVEIMGLVLIYNKPNLKKLGIDEAELAAAEDKK